MPEHAATTTVIAARSLIAVGVVDGKHRNKDRDIRVVVAHRAVGSRDDTDLVPIVVISVANRNECPLRPQKGSPLSSGGAHS